MNIFRRTNNRVLSIIPAVFKFGRTDHYSHHQANDIQSLKSLYNIITQWCIVNNFIILSYKEDRYVPNITGSSMDFRIRQYIYELNIKRLCVSENLNEALTLFEDTEYDRTMSRLIDLHIQILAEVDSRFLNIYINKLIHGLSTLYKDDPAVDVKWSDIFTNYPYLWLLFPLQWLMRTAMIKPSN